MCRFIKISDFKHYIAKFHSKICLLAYIPSLNEYERKFWSISKNTFELMKNSKKSSRPYKIQNTRIYIFQSRITLRMFWYKLVKSNLDIYQGFDLFEVFDMYGGN